MFDFLFGGLNNDRCANEIGEMSDSTDSFEEIIWGSWSPEKGSWDAHIQSRLHGGVGSKYM